MVMFAKVSYILLKGFSERLYVKKILYIPLFLALLLQFFLNWYLSSFVHSEDCPAGYFGYNCTDKCKHPTFGFLCLQSCHCPVCHHVVGCVSTTVKIGNVKVI